jgi:hypothetical protein
MTSASDRLAAALAVWPLDHEQMSFVQQATDGIGEHRAKALVALLLEAESAVIRCHLGSASGDPKRRGPMFSRGHDSPQNNSSRFHDTGPRPPPAS